MPGLAEPSRADPSLAPPCPTYPRLALPCRAYPCPAKPGHALPSLAPPGPTLLVHDLAGQQPWKPAGRIRLGDERQHEFLDRLVARHHDVRQERALERL